MAALKFPHYLPNAVRDYVVEFMDGANGSGGFVTYRDEKAKELEAIKQHISELEKSGDLVSAETREKYGDIKQEHDHLDSHIKCMERLALREQMQEAYAKLSTVLVDVLQWEHFLYAAWAARMDYAPYKKRLERTKKVSDDIAKTADNLAALLREITDSGMSYPNEFYHIRTLLERTDNTENLNDNSMWQVQRPVVLGLHPRKGTAQTDHGSSDKPPVFSIILQHPGDEQEPIDPREQMRNAVSHAWEKAPPFSALLETVAQAAREYEPQPTGKIAAAISSHKGTAHTQYLRAFADLLINTYHFEISAPILNAMAIMATVAFDDPDVDISYDDVRKAIAKMKSKPPEDSTEK
jgi:cell division protein FtsB